MISARTFGHPELVKSTPYFEQHVPLVFVIMHSSIACLVVLFVYVATEMSLDVVPCVTPISRGFLQALTNILVCENLPICCLHVVFIGIA